MVWNAHSWQAGDRCMHVCQPQPAPPCPCAAASQVMLTRPSHMVSGFDPDSIKGKAALVGVAHALNMSCFS